MWRMSYHNFTQWKFQLWFAISLVASAIANPCDAAAEIDQWLSDIARPNMGNQQKLNSQNVSDPSEVSMIAIDTPRIEAADVDRLIAQAKQIKERLYPESKLIEISLRYLRDGQLDLSNADNWFELTFYQKQVDTTKRKGEDIKHLQIKISFRKGEITVDNSSTSSMVAKSVVPFPQCSFKQMLQRALASGFPPAALARVYYRRAPLAHHLSLAVAQWQFIIDEHRESDREIAATDCEGEPVTVEASKYNEAVSEGEKQ